MFESKSESDIERDTPERRGVGFSLRMGHVVVTRGGMLKALG